MSWVLLSLRKSELKMLHAQYVAEDLQISRKERQDARRYQYEQSCIQNEQSKELSELRQDYQSKRKSTYDELSDLRKKLSENENADPTLYGTSDGKTIYDLQEELSNFKEEYEYNYNSIKTTYEDELAMIEQEANDVETMYEENKVEVETQMEAVAQELQVVSQSISQEIQNESIKLS